ncbi:MAG: glutathione S-transferase N-terminal domain-containing protein [Atopobiaceae bacterium]|nr:glutathione S-transferase N-terminal domain-containing protein [Atopobiaceae bacterium]
MANTLDLYYYDACPYCQKVLRAIDRMGIKNKINFKNILQSQEAADTLVRVGGKRQVPCLFIDGVPMYESDDIVAWLTREFA